MGYIVPSPQFVDPKKAVTAKAATATLTAAECNGTNLTNTGASGGIVLTLPAVTSAAGCAFRLYVTVAQTVTFTPASGEKVYLAGSGVASKYLLVAGVIGNTVTIYNDGVDWMVVVYTGVVTKEA